MIPNTFKRLRWRGGGGAQEAGGVRGRRHCTCAHRLSETAVVHAQAYETLRAHLPLMAQAAWVLGKKARMSSGVKLPCPYSPPGKCPCHLISISVQNQHDGRWKSRSAAVHGSFGVEVGPRMRGRGKRRTGVCATRRGCAQTSQRSHLGVGPFLSTKCVGALMSSLGLLLFILFPGSGKPSVSCVTLPAAAVAQRMQTQLGGLKC